MTDRELAADLVRRVKTISRCVLHGDTEDLWDFVAETERRAQMLADRTAARQEVAR